MRRFLLMFAVVAVLAIVPEQIQAIGRGGGGGARGGGGGAFRGGGGGGGFRGGGASSAGASRARTSTPNLGASRPNVSRPNVSRPQARPNISRPASPPQFNRPSGGLTPSTRPATRPNYASRPGSGARPNLPSRPTTLPGAGGSGIASRPGTSLPNLGGSRPGGNRPGSGLQRPGAGGPDLANRPNLGNRPGAGNRPDIGNRPGGNRPGIGGRPGAGGRPNPGDLGDFLGMDRPLRPDNGGRPGGRPGIVNRPGAGGGGVERPGIDRRPGTGDRVDIGDRTRIGDRTNIVNNRPNFGDRNRWSNNNVINNRPQWANIDRSTNININNRWNNAFVNPRRAGWWNPPAGRMGYWNGWGNGVRNNWGYYHRRNNWFTGGWWNNHYCPIGGWHYHYWRHNYPPSYWWTVPVWGGLTSWFTWSAPATVWSQPAYYDYGSGGNVTYENNNVYVGGEQVATADEFAQSAMDLATVPPPASQEQAAETEWMPLGTFAVSMNEKDTDPSLVVQLAISKEGIISGTLYNIQTDQTQAVQGQVDKETQRVAFRIGESETLVAETGLYDLTQEEAPVLVHYGTQRTENWLLVRLEQPQDEAAGQN